MEIILPILFLVVLAVFLCFVFKEVSIQQRKLNRLYDELYIYLKKLNKGEKENV